MQQWTPLARRLPHPPPRRGLPLAALALNRLHGCLGPELLHEEAAAPVGGQRCQRHMGRAVAPPLGARPAAAPALDEVHRVGDHPARDWDVEAISAPFTHIVAAARVEARDDGRVTVGLARARRLVAAAGVVHLAARVLAGAVGVRGVVAHFLHLPLRVAPANRESAQPVSSGSNFCEHGRRRTIRVRSSCRTLGTNSRCTRREAAAEWRLEASR